MKRRKGEAVNHDRWLVSYADFITLLFAFFVVMYASSQADLKKLRKVAESLRESFQSQNVRSGQPPLGTPNQVNDQAQPSIHGEGPLNRIKKRMEESVAMQMGAAGGDLKVQDQPNGLLLRVATPHFFAAGSAEVHEDFHPLLLKIGEVLRGFPENSIRIEGHAEPSELQGSSYPSAWELSAARAAWVARFWVDRLGFSGKRVAVSGKSYYSPLSQEDEKGEWSRAHDRRVEIQVLRSQE